MKYTLVKFLKYVIGSSLVDIVKMENTRPAKLNIEIKSDWLLICFTFVTKSPGSNSDAIDV